MEFDTSTTYLLYRATDADESVDTHIILDIRLVPYIDDLVARLEQLGAPSAEVVENVRYSIQLKPWPVGGVIRDAALLEAVDSLIEDPTNIRDQITNFSVNKCLDFEQPVMALTGTDLANLFDGEDPFLWSSYGPTLHISSDGSQDYIVTTEIDLGYGSPLSGAGGRVSWSEIRRKFFAVHTEGPAPTSPY